MLKRNKIRLDCKHSTQRLRLKVEILLTTSRINSYLPNAGSKGREFEFTSYFFINKYYIFKRFADPCETEGCSAPYNIGCRLVNNTAQCICPTCPNRRRPICASDDVQDLTECHMRRQACLGDISVTVAKQSPCGKFSLIIDKTNKLHLDQNNRFTLTVSFNWYQMPPIL